MIEKDVSILVFEKWELDGFSFFVRLKEFSNLIQNNICIILVI